MHKLLNPLESKTKQHTASWIRKVSNYS